MEEIEVTNVIVEKQKKGGGPKNPGAGKTSAPTACSLADAGEWDRMVEASRDASIFHRHGFLAAMARESQMELMPIVVRGKEPVGLFPLFVKRVAFAKFGFSPPPGVLAPHLGPVLLREVRHQADRERAEAELAEAVTNHFDRDLGLSYLQFSSTPGAFDPRPYQWKGYKPRPFFTYGISLRDGADVAINGFKKQLRTDARRACQYPELRQEVGGLETYRDIVRLTRRRYREQGETWAPSDAYLDDVFQSLNEGAQRVRCWGVYAGDALVSGVIVLFDRGLASHWIGGVRYDAPFIGVNEWLHRTVIEEAVAAGCHTYELMGGNTERLCRHKARYNPTPIPFFHLERRTGAGGAAARVLEIAAVRRILKNLMRGAAG